MWSRFKEAFNNMGRGAKSFALYAYFSAMVYFIVIWFLGMDIIELGIGIGLISAIVVEPIIETSEKGNKARGVRAIFRFTFAKNILSSASICFLLAWIGTVINNYWFNFGFEPISFGLAFASIHRLLSFIYYSVARLIKRTLSLV